MKGKQQDFRTEKYIRYGIRKYSFGAASVAIAAGLMFLGNGAVSATEVQGAETIVAAASAEKTDQNITEVKPETEKNAEAKPEVKAEETKKVNKAPLEASIATLESKLSTAKYADASVVANVREALATAKAVLANETAKQEEVNVQKEILSALRTVVIESNKLGLEKEQADKDKAAKEEVEKKATPAEKALLEANSALDKVSSEADVTNTLAATELRKKEVAAENRAAIEAAVAKNQAVLNESKVLLADKSVTKEQVDAQLARLNESILAVYSELKKAGIGRDGNYSVALSADEGYTYDSRELRKENGEFATATGKSYKVLDGNDKFRLYVHGYQSENTDVKSSNNGRPDVGGRTDIPLSKTEAKKIADEALLWRGKVRASGRNNNNNTWGAGGPYEYLTTEIYGYTYEQGTHYVYLTDVKKRFSLSQEAEAAGYSIKKIDLGNLVPGTAYNENTDTVEGYVASNLQNGVYDMRYIITVEKDGQTQQVAFRDLTAGWIGWQDSSAPSILGTSKMVTIGDEVNHDIKYVDNEGMNKDERAGYVYANDGSKVLAGSKTAPSTTKAATFTAIDGTKVRTMSSPQTVNAHTALNGVYTGKDTSIADVIPGLNYDPTTGKIHGTASEAGIYTVAALAKDYNNSTNATNIDWNMDGQEAHENITIAVAPKVTVSNVEAYATKVPVTVSNGANKAEITMPDGTVTKLVVKDGKWTVAAGTTNTAVKEGDQLGDASTTTSSKFNLPVTSDSTQYVGVDSIAAKATTDKVRADIQREVVKVKDANNKEYTATFNSATGKYALANEDAYVLKDNGDGTTTLTERRVYTDAKADGSVDYIVYEFTRTWNATSNAATLTEKVAEIRKNGEVTAVGDVIRTVTVLPKEQTSDTKGVTVTVTYDSVTNKWTASDGSTVTAEKSNAGWKISTDSGFKGYVAYREAIGNDVASIQNDKPTASSTSYAETKDNSVDLLKSPKANVEFEDVIDDKSDDAESETIKTKLTVTAPDGTKKEFNLADAEEKAYIQAQRTAAEKTQAAATAIEEAQAAHNELARIQEQVDRQVQMIADAEAALANLKLRTISGTAKDLAEKKLKDVKDFKASLDEKLQEAQGKLPELTAKVTSSRQEALEAEKAVEAARTALKTKATENLSNPEIAAYTLGQYGSYKVTVRAVDSNGVVTTPTVGKTDDGEVTDDAVAETTYYIVVSKPEKSAGAEGKEQTDSMATGFKTGLPNDAEVSDYKLVDPVSSKKTDSVTTEEGTYAIDGETGNVSFTPAPGFVGNAKPLTVAANVTITGDDGQPVTVESSTTYTPTVYGVKSKDDETTGKQGQVQTSIPGSERFSELNTGANTPDGTNVDWTTAKYSLEGANEEGKVVVEGEGTYAIDPATGAVTFTPEPSFKGQAKGVEVKVSVTATDSEGNKVEVTSSGDYTPEVEAVEPTAEPKKTSGKQGRPQTQDATTMFKEGDTTAPIDNTTIKLVDSTGAEVTTLPATKDGKQVGTYTIDPTTGVITFQPNKDFTGTPEPAKVVAADKNGTKVETTYTPTVTPVVPEGQDKTTTGLQGDPQQSTVTFTPGDPEFPIDIKVPATFEDGTTEKVVPNEGTYTVDPDGTVHFTPEKQFRGVAKGVTVKRVDTNGTPATAKYTPIVKPVVPEGFDNVTIGAQGQEQHGKPYFQPGDPTKPIDESVPPKFIDANGQPINETTIPAKTPEGKEIGTYTINPQTGVITFTPTDKSYVGPVQPATVQRQDTNGTTVDAEYTPVIVGVKPTAKPATSEDVQGATQKQPITFTGGTADLEDPAGKKVESAPVPINPDSVTLLGEDGQPANEVEVKDPKDPTKVIGKYTLVKEPGKDPVAVYTPTDKTYVGSVPPVTIQAADTNGTTVKTTYTPNITPVKPTATPAKTKDIQGKEQTQDATTLFKEGNPVAPIKNDTIKLVDPTGAEVTEMPALKDGIEVGKYVVDPTTGIITFKPNKDFVGTPDPAKVVAADENGTKVETTYTPTVTPVKPTGEDVTSEDIQGAEQKGTPLFLPGNFDVPITINAAQPAKLIDPETGKPTDETSVNIPGEGTYTINPNSGEVTFTPEKDFTGVATGVTVQVKDANGTPVEASYTPKVKGVTPTATPAKSKDIQGVKQTGLPEFVGGKVTVNDVEKTVKIDETKAPQLIDPETGEPTDEPVVIPGEGTYTVENGMVVFTPEPQFTGKGEGVEVQRVDENGTPVTAKYTPTVVPVTPTGEDKTSTGPKGQVQTGTPEFEGGSAEINGKKVTVEIDTNVPAKLVDPKTGDPVDSVTVDGEGTYTIDPNSGKVTFTPEPEFLGTATGVTVQRQDTNGTEVTAKYTPTVTPVTKTVDKTSEGAKNTPQSNTPEFTGDVDLDVPPTFDDGTTTRVVEGEGTYTIDTTGKVTFTPEPEFTGTADGITVVRKDKLGKTISAQYTPTVRPDTEFVDENGNPIKGYPSEDGTTPKKDIPEYRYVETVTDEYGNTRHIYKQVVTLFKDKEGNEIPNYPVEKGTTPKKDNIPEYRFVETKKLPNGDTEHVYEKVSTFFKDKDGNEISEKGTGTVDKKDIPEYRFVETKKLPNGDTEHVYEKVTTFFKDKDGKELPNTPSEKGIVEKKDVPGYKFVETKKLPNGDIEHIYEKETSPTPTPSPVPQPNPGKQNTTTWTDENGNPLKPTEPGSKEPGTIPGYEYVKTVTDSNGNIRHIFRKVEMPTPTPVEPTQPAQPVEPATPAIPEQSAKPQMPATPKYVEGQKELPNTGTEANASLAALGLLGALSGFGLLARKKKED